MKRLCSPTRRPVRVAPVRPNAGLSAGYQAKIDALVARMAASVQAAVTATYKRNPPEIAQDDSPSAAMREAIAGLASEWTKRFDDLAQSAGKKFPKDAMGHADRAFAANLRKAGFSVKFDGSRVTNDIIQAAIADNVSLIRSIAPQYFTQIQSLVSISAQVGGDLGKLTDELQKQFGVTRRRAAFIATDQQSKVITAITRARQDELGIQTARWLHSAGGREPRVHHVAFSQGREGGPFYNVKEGALIEGERIWPGQKPRCRCVSVSVVMPA